MVDPRQADEARPSIISMEMAPLAISSLLFGLDHYEGGLTYILLATIAGLFYGHTYWKTTKIETSISVHFSFNLTHFLFFSYPSMIAS
jgi:membrane protease YdiL (CAAX protease family)